jgi:hypothetical protein
MPTAVELPEPELDGGLTPRSRPVHRFPLAGQRELRARRATAMGGRVVVHVTLWDCGTPSGTFTLFAEDLAALALATQQLAATIRPAPERRRRGRVDADRDGGESCRP